MGMQTRRLGSAGLELSVIGFGAWEAGGGSEWGAPPPREQIVDAIRSVLDTGINWIDTAEVYGDGHSEELVGEAVVGHRDEVLIASKVGPSPEGTGFRPEEVAEACRKSLKRLGTDRIDLYQLHWPDFTGVPLEETWEAMTALVDEGLVGAIGVSNFDRELIERCEAIRHVDSLQQRFSMLVLEDRELIRWCGEQGIGVLSYAPLAFGLLTGAIAADTVFGAADHRGPEDEFWSGSWARLFDPPKRARGLAVVDGMRPIAERLGCSIAQLALAWNVHQPGVTSAIAGSRNPGHVRTNADAGTIALDDATLADLETLLLLGPAFAE
jgi:aryl-alcohol dehydrogenase-like predicted oxidoreductase